jgi:large subunit ribosomal protein L30
LPSRKLRVTLTRSLIGLKPGHVRTLQALGLRRIRATVVHDDTPVIRGMIARVPYAVRVEPAESDVPQAEGRTPQAEGRRVDAAGRNRRDQTTKEQSA